jgi:molecular chaperone DnaK
MPQIEVTFDIDANGIAHVSAKDKGTGKEQRITISGTGALSEDEIDRMVSDAKAHGDDDRRRREKAETHNRLDNMIYDTEKAMGEHRDKLDAAVRAEIENAVADGKKALDGDDQVAMAKAIEHLTQSSHKLAAVMYQQAGAEKPGDAPQPPQKDDVVDAEYVDVDKT